MLAATSGHQQVVQLLVDHEAPVDCTDKNSTPGSMSPCVVM